jgi:hypothetical protein
MGFKRMQYPQLSGVKGNFHLRVTDVLALGTYWLESFLGWQAYKCALAVRVQGLDNSTRRLLVLPYLEKDSAQAAGRLSFRLVGKNIAVKVIQRIRGFLGPQL